MADHINGKVVIVTGAASGFGRLVSRKAAARGAKVLCLDIDEKGLAETVDAEGEMTAERCDVTNLAELKSAAGVAVERFGAIDVIINNAGTMPLAFFSDHAAASDAWSKCIDINIKGVLNGIVAVYDQMMLQGRGQVINLSSIYGNFPVVGAAVYGATKAAVNFISESLRMETRGVIKVTNVKPTGVPGTNLAASVVNLEALGGILGANAPGFFEEYEKFLSGQMSADLTDADNTKYFALDPEYIAEQVLYTIDQPWGVSIGDITVRASGDSYVL